MVLPETSSGEHKFKLVNLAVGSMVNITQQLEAVSARMQQAAHKAA